MTDISGLSGYSQLLCLLTRALLAGGQVTIPFSGGENPQLAFRRGHTRYDIGPEGQKNTAGWCSPTV